MTLHISFKSHIPLESQKQHFTEYQNISRNFKQTKLHQQTYSFRKVIKYLMLGRNAPLARVPTCASSVQVKLKVYDYMQEPI